MQKRLEFLLKHMTGRRGMVPSDTDPDLHVRIIYYVLNKFPEFGAEVVLSTLLGTNPAVALQQFIPGSPSTMTSLHIDEEPIYGSPQVLYSLQAPQLISSSISVASTSSLGESSIPFEKYVVALRAFKYHLNDVQALQVSTAAANSSQSSSFGRAGSFSGNSSNFGTSYIVVESKMTLSAPPFPTYSDTATFEVCDAISHTPKSDTVLPDVISHHSYAKLSGSIRSILDKANEVMGSLGPILESSFSKSSISELISGSQYSTAPMTPNAMSSRRSSFSDSTGSMYLSGPADMKQTGERPMILEMLKTWMDLIPTASPTGMSPQSVIALIARQVFSGHDYIRDSALKALLRMASIKTEKNDFWKLDVGEWSTFVLDTMMQNALSYFTEGLVRFFYPVCR